MANLSIGSGAGTQTNAQNPQSLASSTGGTASSSSVQPGGSNLQPNTTSTPTGIALRPTQLPTVNFNNIAEPTTNSSATVAVTAAPKHHINGGFLGVAGGLFLIAIIVFFIINRSAKNTTNYK